MDTSRPGQHRPQDALETQPWTYSPTSIFHLDEARYSGATTAAQSARPQGARAPSRVPSKVGRDRNCTPPLRIRPKYPKVPHTAPLSRMPQESGSPNAALSVNVLARSVPHLAMPQKRPVSTSALDIQFERAELARLPGGRAPFAAPAVRMRPKGPRSPSLSQLELQRIRFMPSVQTGAVSPPAIVISQSSAPIASRPTPAASSEKNMSIPPFNGAALKRSTHVRRKDGRSDGRGVSRMSLTPIITDFLSDFSEEFSIQLSENFSPRSSQEPSPQFVSSPRLSYVSHHSTPRLSTPLSIRSMRQSPAISTPSTPSPKETQTPCDSPTEWQASPNASSIYSAKSLRRTSVFVEWDTTGYLTPDDVHEGLWDERTPSTARDGVESGAALKRQDTEVIKDLLRQRLHRAGMDMDMDTDTDTDMDVDTDRE